MARVFITGSADGLGLELARELVDAGHEVVVHGRSESRARDAAEAVPDALAALAGDLASLEQVRALAAAADEHGPYRAVVHNAALGMHEQRTLTAEGVERVFAVNVLAPYVLTALMAAPERLIYLSSGLHRRGRPRLEDLAWEQRPWADTQAYADSKLMDTALALAFAARLPETLSNAVGPGWIATKMGGAGAPGTLQEGVDTQRWLALSDEPAARVTGRLFHRRQVEDPHPLAACPEFQRELLEVCERISGVAPPGG